MCTLIRIPEQEPLWGPTKLNRDRPPQVGGQGTRGLLMCRSCQRLALYENVIKENSISKLVFLALPLAATACSLCGTVVNNMNVNTMEAQNQWGGGGWTLKLLHKKTKVAELIKFQHF